MDRASAPKRFNHVHIEPIGGVAGDMLLGALIDLGQCAETVRAQLSRLAEPELVLRISHVDVPPHRGLHVRSIESKNAPPRHRRLGEIEHILRGARLPDPVLERALAIYHVLAKAEAAAHGSRVGEVELHEVGALDSLLDVVGICAAVWAIGDPTFSSGEVPSGHGTVETQHGRLECPVPATLHVCAASGVPLEPVDVEGETATPTGVAALAALVSVFEARDTRGAASRGVGAGTRRFATRPNVVVAHGWE